MIIAQMVIEVLAVIASTTAAVISFRSARRARKARLRSASQGFTDGLIRQNVTLPAEAAAKFREELVQAVRRDPGKFL